MSAYGNSVAMLLLQNARAQAAQAQQQQQFDQQLEMQGQDKLHREIQLQEQLRMGEHQRTMDRVTTRGKALGTLGEDPEAYDNAQKQEASETGHLVGRAGLVRPSTGYDRQALEQQRHENRMTEMKELYQTQKPGFLKEKYGFEVKRLVRGEQLRFRREEYMAQLKAKLRETLEMTRIRADIAKDPDFQMMKTQLGVLEQTGPLGGLRGQGDDRILELEETMDRVREKYNLGTGQVRQSTSQTTRKVTPPGIKQPNRGAFDTSVNTAMEDILAEEGL